MKRYFLTFLVGVALSALGFSNSLDLNPWRSSLYPSDWQPGYTDAAGRHLPDYSYAGYHSGIVALPSGVKGAIYDVTQRPYSADSSGQADATAAIQRAIDAATAAGGGTVYLPAGTYKLRPRRSYALRISGSNILLKGDGPGKTFLFNDDPLMREKGVILIAPAYANSQTVWNSADIALDEVLLPADVPADSLMLAVPDASAFRVGERILLRISTTAEFVEELGAGYPINLGEGLMFYRQIVGIDPERAELHLDAPVRFSLKTRDQARITRLKPPLEEVGIEGFSFAMRETPRDGFEENDHQVSGTGAYDAHRSAFLQMNHVVNGWIRNLATYRPAENSRPVTKLPLFAFASLDTPAHILSKGIVIESSRQITVDRVDIRYPQYLGGGGNGYLLQLNANDILVTNSTFVGGRHNVIVSSGRASGNVIYKSAIRDEYISSDHHGHMSAANLFDSTVLDGAVYDIGYNDNPSVVIGPTSSQTTYWNTEVGNCQVRWRGTDEEMKVDYFVLSHQYQWGYIIGSRGDDPACVEPYVRVSERSHDDGKGTAPEDFVEGVGRGASLQPQSLYQDQLARRRAHMGAEPEPSPTPPPPGATPDPDADVSILQVASGAAYTVIPAGAQLGQRIFTDRTVTFTSVPSDMIGLTLVQTRDEDRIWQGPTLLTLRLRRPATIYLAFDSRILHQIPPWLSADEGWINTGRQIALSEEGKTHTLFRKDVPAGAAALGGAELDSSYFNYYLLIELHE